jgi:hypothetical protein
MLRQHADSSDEQSGPQRTNPCTLSSKELAAIMSACQTGFLSATDTQPVLEELKDGKGLVTACEVLLQDIVDVSNSNERVGADGSAGPCGAVITQGSIAYKCMVTLLTPTFPCLCILCV